MSYVSKFTVVNAWNEVHPFGSGCTAGLDTERLPARRGWEVNCSCGRTGFVYETEEGLAVEKHMPNGQLCSVYVRYSGDKGRETTMVTFAMAAMSNVMRCVDQALTCKAFVVPYPEQPGREPHADDRVELDSTLSSEEWSRRVREGVKALPKPGPVVTCQSEED